MYPGNYSVTFALPAGMSFTSQNQGADDAKDSDVASDGIASATLKSGDNNLTLDAGVRPASVAGRVWIDNNTSNAQDDGLAAENGVVGVSINLIDTKTGKVVATTTTGADGLYNFTGVLPGNYQVQVIEPAEMGFVKQDQGGDDTKDSDVAVADGKSHAFDVKSGDAIIDVDAGIEPGALGDHVWLDLNGNNLQDSGEPGVANVTVNLLNGGGTVVATQTTDATGFYNFAAVLPGNYTVQFVPPAGMTLVTANVGSNDTLDSDPGVDGKVAVTVVSGVGNQTVDAGIVPAKLGDFVWWDQNGDGTQGASEPAVVGMSVNLLDKDGKSVLDAGGNAMTAITDAQGKYEFVVLPGEYRVGFVLPAGATFSKLDQGSNDAADSDADLATGLTPVVKLVSGDVNTTLDVGLSVSSVSGYVLEDRNANGVHDAAEPGIAGVSLTLVGNDVFGNPLTATATTNADGFYSFSVPAGTYTVTETNPVTYLSSGSKAGSAAGAAVVDADSVTTPAPGGSTSERNDFFDYRIGSIAGQVRDDVDYDGALADVETGIPGVTIILLRDDVEVARTATDSDGKYLFPNLKPGNYVVVETDLALWNSTADIEGANDNRIAVALASAQHSTGNDFLDSKQKGSLSGVVWTDTDTDGVRDAEETGIPGATVTVVNADGTVVATLTTDANGAYRAEQLPPGEYLVKVDPASLPSGVQQTADPDAAKDHQTTANVNPGTETSGLDFGYVGSVSLGDRAWHDLNANGMQDASEPGVAGVLVTLFQDANGDGVPAANEQVSTQITGADGAYQFSGLLPLDYLLTFSQPEGYLRSASNQGADDALDSDADANGLAAVSLKSGSNQTVDAGFYRLGSLGDYVWLDMNDNGKQDASEPAMPGVTVQLLSADTQLAATTTDANGKYVFTDLPPAVYTVKFVLPNGMAFATAKQGADDALDSDADSNGVVSVTLTSGLELRHVDAGIKPAAISGRVWSDNQTPNAQDDGIGTESGVVGVGVNLIDVKTGKVVATTTTGADGIYQFTGVLPGDYQVQVIEPANMGFVQQDQGGDDAKDSDVNVEDGKSHTFTVKSGDSITDVDAGIEPGALGDRVWLDSNGNGLQDSGEPGIANVTVNLLDGSGAIVATQTTDATGFYNFAAVLPGDYTVQFVVPAGMTLVTANQGTDDTLDSDSVADGKVAVTIVSGVGNQTVDAGIVPAKLGDYVWQDLNGDGKQDAAEPMVAGLVVNLLDKDGKPMLDVGGNAITTTTDQDGKYQFMVVPGEYRVGFSLPTGVAATTADQGADDAADSDADPATLMTPAVTLASGAEDVTLDLGLAPATVSGYVIEDANANGVQDSGELVIVGVSVTLTGKDAFGVEITQTTTTDANGLYSFTVPAGEYTLKETNPEDYFSSGSKAGSAAGASVVGMDEVMTPVAGGTTSERNDFFDYRVGSIAGQVRDDVDYDGALADVETGVPGVTIILLRDDVEVARTATDSEGKYLFPNLKPGNYVVVETDLALWNSTADIEGANDNRVAVTLASAQHSTGNDFLDSKQQGSLSGVVWTDTDTDGVRDAEETGIPGVTVKVLDSNGTVVATLTTDNTGAYSATDLPPGNYTVQIDPATLPAGSQQTGDPDAVLDHQTVAEVKPAQATSGLDFGYVGNVYLGDRVWHDLNANGIQDDGEPGLAGVTVMLYRDANGNGLAEPDEQLKSVVTPASGAYLFADLLPLDYLVKFTLPNGYLRSSSNQGADDALDSDTDADGQVAVSLKTGANNTIDAGFYQLAKLGDYVWLDANGNGVQDADEPVMAGVEVQLLDSAGQTLASTTTDSNGKYLFSDLTPAAYSVKFVAPTGMSFTAIKQGTDAALDSDADGNGLATVTLISGETQLGMDAGITPAAISGRVWSDNQTPNAQDDGIGTESGVVGVGVNLIDVKTGKVVATTTTGADGIYQFTGVLPGDYQVQVIEPANMGFVKQDQGGDDAKDSDVNVEDGKSHTFTVKSGDSITDVDAGIEPGALGDRVWLDSNGNGLQDSGEPGIANVTVNLLDGGGAIVATQTTDATGFYNFAAVLPGEYTVQFVVPAGMTLVTANQGSDKTLDSDPATDGKIAVAIVSGVGNQTVDAGIVPAKLGDYVWQDLNGDGKQDANESAVAGLVVNLLDKDGKPMLDVGGNAITITTDQDGKYQFMVLPGEYRVGFSLPAGVAATKADQGSDDAADSDADPATLMTPAVTLASGAEDVTLDLGLAPATVSGYVIEDANANGVQDSGELVIVGVSVTLTGKDAFGVDITQTTTTDANGLYSFTVPAGEYTLKETNPADYFSSGSKAGSAAGASVVGMDELTTPVAGGTTSERNDFFDYRIGSIAGQVRDDVDYDGALADVETGIPGVTIILLRDDVEVARTATDSDGKYSFPNLKPGNYVVVETDLALWDSTADIEGANDNRVAVTLASAQHSTGNDFLDSKQQGSLSGVVWTDTDTDGVRDVGEPVLAGVSVTVLDSSGNPVATLTTNEQGVYSAADLPPGTYTVKIDPASLPAGAQQTGDPDGVKDHQTQAVVKPSQETSGLDFGYVTLVSLGDKVWHDLNANGVQDADEPGLAGVMVALYRDTNNNGIPDADEQVKAVLTDGTGAYLFSKLLPLDYLVTFSQPDGYQRSPAKQGSDDALDSDTNAQGVVAISLTADTTAVDAGFYKLGKLGDYVWLDANANGLQEVDEPAITGMTVQLLDSAGAVVATTTTDATGMYQFKDVVPAAYSVKFVAPEGIAFTQTKQGTDAALDSDADASGVASVTLASGQTIDTVDAGILPAAVSGRVWIDRNANGLDDTETGVPGVRVNLLDAKTGEVVATTTTGAEGQYNFTGILPGEYLIETVQPATMVFVTPDQGDDDARDSDVQVANGRSPSFVLNSSASVTDVDAGIQPGELGDHVWLDQNNNGLQDAGEPGIGKITVNLLDGSGNPVATQVTDATGFYNFTGVLPGDYSVQFVLPEWAQFTATDKGSDDELDSDVDAAGKVAVSVVSNVGNQTVDAGIVPATISGTVLDDRNANGAQNDDDKPVAGVVVTITGTDAFGNPVTLETTTDADGNYSIAVPPGTYTVREINPSDAVSTGSEAGTQGSAVADKDTLNVNVSSGQVSANNDFLDYMPARLSGQVRDDSNGNGVLTDADSGIASISIGLWLEDTLVATEMTDADGYYVFENLLPGTYSVREADRNGWISTADVDGANDNSISVTVQSGDDKPGQDFLDTLLANITGQVREDTDRDGDLQDADQGMAGVTVTLLLDGKPIQTTTTNDKGEYSFTAVPPGNYVISTTDPNPYAPSGDVDGGQDGEVALTVISGIAVTDQDFLYASVLGSLGDLVWLDRNNDSLQDSSEPVLSGIKVVLSGKDSAGNAVSLTTTTDASGNYLFTALPPGVYTLEYQLPLGMRLTLPNQGSNEALDSDPEILSRQVTVTLTAGEHNRDVDAGVRPAAVSGSFWEDNNGDGLLTHGERPLMEIPVRLYTDPNGDGDPADGELVGTTSSNAGGDYGFSGLMPGTYVVVVTPPANYLPVTPNQGDDPNINSGVLADRSMPVTLESGDNVDKNGGFYEVGSFGDRVWLDLNGNGKQDAGEPGIRDVTLALLDSAGKPVMNPLNPEQPYRVVSDVNGEYRFDNLLPGQYFAQIDNLDGFVLTQTDAGTDDAMDSDANANGRMSAVVQSGLHNPAVDAGLLPASVTGRVWIDHNSSNGIDDGMYPEPGAVGVVVNLLDKDGKLVMTTTTGVDGIYSFVGVLPGEYQLEFVTPDNMKLVAANQGEDDTRDSDADIETGRSPLFSVTSSKVVQDVDAGIQAGALGDRVWVDLNENGVQDAGEPGVAGVTVKLMDGNGKDVALTTTDASGFYAFRDVVPGTYTVQFVLTDDMKLTVGNQGDDDAIDSDADPATGKATAVVASGAPGNQTVDAGILPAKIGDYVWLDANKNGVQDAGEMPLANVTVLLLDEAGNMVASTETDASGKYQFSVPAGSYSVQLIALDTAFATAGQGDDAERDSDVNSMGATPLAAFTSGTTNLTLDAGILPATISGKVVNDLWANGTVEPADGVIANVTLTLSGTDSFGNPVSLSTVSAADGSYQFLVPPGTYTLTETQPQGYVSTGSSAGTGDGKVISHDQVQVSVASNATVQNVNFLDYDPASYVVLSGKVVDDRNHNGVEDAQESGLPTVTVTLFTDPNGDGDPADGVAIETVTTDSSGSFTFAGVPPGQYLVVETDPANYESTADSAGANDNRVPVTLVSGQVPPKPLFLDAKPQGSLSGQVLLDADNDGDLADPDNGLVGITMQLFSDPNGDGNPDDGASVGSVLTDETGRYVFTNVLAGNWVVVATDKPGHVSTADLAMPNDNRIPVVVDVVDGSSVCRLPDGKTTCTGLNFLDAQLNSGILLQKTAYQGHDAGAKCGTEQAKTEMTLVDLDKDKRENVTYCFEITNTGDNWLAQVALLDETLGLSADKLKPLGSVPALLAPLSKDANARIRYYYEHVITAGIVNKASVTAKPAQPDGTLLGDALDASSQSSVNVRFVFDPPTALKTVTATGEQVMLWQMVWINSSSDTVAGVEIYDGVPEGTYYAAMEAGAHVSADGVYCETRGTSRTDICRYEAPSKEFPRGRVFWKGSIGADLGNTTEETATNEVVIRFYSVLNQVGEQQTIENQASSSWDMNGDGKPEYADVRTDNNNTDQSGDSTSISIGAPTQIPTLGEWALWMLSLLMLLVAFGYRRKAS
ncbi:IPTL-CTERM sorting domain-containing protein [Thiothrix winogradskyi]|uniref:IPTL-CTERM sorting domain-containing protein n=1 Tax=Thiothrix winogradskyi TaxID=96472 RepID=A0ABY3T4Y6_9GAMM|nr:IPTL-CTERM sorting domain-containing protein [Thiothrix winogradskyi]UJS26611.1 IPTL-CTERM sorting domain-containing protein [Thiothrix winogradskyi]